jgi:hypothetical protein
MAQFVELLPSKHEALLQSSVPGKKHCLNNLRPIQQSLQFYIILKQQKRTIKNSYQHHTGIGKHKQNKKLSCMKTWLNRNKFLWLLFLIIPTVLPKETEYLNHHTLKTTWF